MTTQIGWHGNKLVIEVALSQQAKARKQQEEPQNNVALIKRWGLEFSSA